MGLLPVLVWDLREPPSMVAAAGVAGVARFLQKGTLSEMLRTCPVTNSSLNSGTSCKQAPLTSAQECYCREVIRVAICSRCYVV